MESVLEGLQDEEEKSEQTKLVLEGMQDEQAEKNQQLVKQGRGALSFPSRCGFDRGETLLLSFEAGAMVLASVLSARWAVVRAAAFAEWKPGKAIQSEAGRAANEGL